MKTYQTDQIKGIAIIGNSGSGKTILAEAMLFNGGVIEFHDYCLFPFYANLLF